MISVCIATYNGEKYIKEQLLSIVKQLGEEDEIIISDDNSTDDTLKIIREFGDTRIKIFTNNEKGYSSNFENALKQATGEFIFLSDQDDIWVKNKVEICLNELQKYDLVVSDCTLINSDGEMISDSYYSQRKIYRTGLGNLIKFSFLGCCLAFRANILKKALPFPPNRKYCTHDNWLFLVSCCLYNHKVLDDKLIYYRRHQNNASDGGFKNNTSIWFKIKYRVYLVYKIISRI